MVLSVKCQTVQHGKGVLHADSSTGVSQFHIGSLLLPSRYHQSFHECGPRPFGRGPHSWGHRPLATKSVLVFLLVSVEGFWSFLFKPIILYSVLISNSGPWSLRCILRDAGETYPSRRWKHATWPRWKVYFFVASCSSIGSVWFETPVQANPWRHGVDP